MKVTDANSEATADEEPPLSLGALVHGVVNSTASIAFSAKALRAGTNLSASDLEALARIEQAAALVADTVKRFASAAPTVRPAPESGATIDLYDLCCGIAEERRREQGRTIFCRAFGDSRGRWDHAQVVELIERMLDSATTYLGSAGALTLTTSGFGRHVRLSVHAPGHLSPEAKRACLEIPSKVDPSLGGLMTVKVGSGPGTVLSMHLPR